MGLRAIERLRQWLSGTGSPVREHPPILTRATLLDHPGWAAPIGALALEGEEPPPAPGPLIEGTERFAEGDILAFHEGASPGPPSGAWCFFLRDAVVSDEGRVWVDDALLTDSAVLPPYVRGGLGLEAGGSADLRRTRMLPVRSIDEPTVLLVGHGLQVYGHFVIEMLLRVLAVRRALEGRLGGVRFLLDGAAPGWLLGMLTEDLGIPPEHLLFFDGRRERVRLRRALVAGNLGGSHDGFHPVCGRWVDDLIPSLRLPPAPREAGVRVFLVRGGVCNPASGRRRCLNEEQLVDRAGRRGFVPVSPETLPWKEQIAMVLRARTLVGLWGSALHTALLAPPGLCVGSIGCLNRVQSNIGALRGHRLAYLTRRVPQSGDFTVDVRTFEEFLDAVCTGAAAVAPE